MTMASTTGATWGTVSSFGGSTVEPPEDEGQTFDECVSDFSDDDEFVRGFEHLPESPEAPVENHSDDRVDEQETGMDLD